MGTAEGPLPEQVTDLRDAPAFLVASSNEARADAFSLCGWRTLEGALGDARRWAKALENPTQFCRVYGLVEIATVRKLPDGSLVEETLPVSGI
jgi:hypothetical protein